MCVRRLLGLFFFMLFMSTSHAQLEEIYYGTYYNQSKSNAFTFFAPEQPDSSCFLFELTIDSTALIPSQRILGIGLCYPNQDRYALLADSLMDTLWVSFQLGTDGLVSVLIHADSAQQEEFTSALIDIEKEMDVQFPKGEEQFYSGEDVGDIVLLRKDSVLFVSIYGIMNAGCTQNEFSGKFEQIPNADRLFRCKIADGCYIDIEMHHDYLKVREFNCDVYHPANSGCEPWQGRYELIEE